MKDSESGKYLMNLRISRTGLFVAVISMIVIFCALTYCAIAYTPIKTFIPGYPDAQSKRTAIQNAIKVDSLEKVIYRWELYSENMKRAVEGKAPISPLKLTGDIICLTAFILNRPLLSLFGLEEEA